jgi:hypothetical protein
MKITLIHWNAADGKERAKVLRAEYQVKLEVSDPPTILRNLRADPPSAVVIDLDRLPMQGRDLGVAIRTGKQTRSIPLVFVGGNPQKVARVAQTLPDATYTSWAGVAAALKRALAKPLADPIVPVSNLAGYSGTPLPKKLGIKPNSSLALLSQPEGFVETLGELPPRTEVGHRITPGTGVAIWFVRSAGELASQIDSIARRVADARSCRLWIAWAKRGSPLATDVTEAAGRTAALAASLVDYKVAAIDADWSGLLFAPRRNPAREARVGNSLQPRHR